MHLETAAERLALNRIGAESQPHIRPSINGNHMQALGLFRTISGHVHIVVQISVQNRAAHP